MVRSSVKSGWQVRHEYNGVNKTRENYAKIHNKQMSMGKNSVMLQKRYQSSRRTTMMCIRCKLLNCKNEVKHKFIFWATKMPRNSNKIY